MTRIKSNEVSVNYKLIKFSPLLDGVAIKRTGCSIQGASSKDLPYTVRQDMTGITVIKQKQVNFF